MVSSALHRSHAPLSLALGVAARQHGLLTWAQARSCGLPRGDVRRLVRRQEWRRRLPRVYAVRALTDGGDEAERLRQAVMAAQLALGPAAFAGTHTAARLWGLQGLRPWDGQEVHMVVPAPAAQRQITGIRLHTWDTAPEEVARTGSGLRLTTPGRTLRDLLLDVDRATAVCLLDSALHQRLVRAEDLAALEAANRGRRGCRRSRPWWSLADGRAQSPLETRVRLVCVDGGLPPSDLQHPFYDTRGDLLARTDFWWADRRLVGEADGLGPHSLPEALARDRVRQNALQAHVPGVRIVRFTWEDLKRPGYILATVAGAGGGVR